LPYVFDLLTVVPSRNSHEADILNIKIF
jgi:hypothetical protein